MTDYEKDRRRADERQHMREAARAAFPAYLRSVHGLTEPQISGKKLLRCLNPQHNDADASMRYYPEDAHLYCFGCRARYDLPALIAADNGLTISAAETWEIVRKWTGDPASGSLFQSGQAPGAAPSRPPEKEEPAPPQDFTGFYAECIARRSDPRFLDYIKRRGISLDTADVFGLGFAPEWRMSGTRCRSTPRIIIPTGCGSYCARLAMPETPDGTAKVMKIGGKNPLFNLQAFNRNTALFIVEGELDCLSIEQCGGSSAALGSTSNVQKLLHLIPALCEDRTAPIVIMTDADAAGRTAAAELAEGFTAMRKAGQIPAFRVLNFTAYPDGLNDPNDLLQKRPDLLTGIVRKVGFTENIIDRLCRIAGYQIHEIESEGKVW